jgi:hypothetical protein
MDHIRIMDALRDLVFDPDPGVPLGDVVDRYYNADYTHRTGGVVLNRSEFQAMVAGARTQIARGSGVVVDELRDGSAYAERHRFRVEFIDGTVQNREIAIFGTVGEDGRFEHLSEVGFALPDVGIA